MNKITPGNHIKPEPEKTRKRLPKSDCPRCFGRGFVSVATRAGLKPEKTLCKCVRLRNVSAKNWKKALETIENMKKELKKP